MLVSSRTFRVIKNDVSTIANAPNNLSIVERDIGQSLPGAVLHLLRRRSRCATKRSQDALAACLAARMNAKATPSASASVMARGGRQESGLVRIGQTFGRTSLPSPANVLLADDAADPGGDYMHVELAEHGGRALRVGNIDTQVMRLRRILL